MPTLLLADDSDFMRNTVKRLLEAEPAIVLLGEAANFEEAIAKTAALQPDILLLDLHMPDDRSLNSEFIKAQLTSAGSRTRIIGISLSGNDDNEARNLGASLGAITVLEKARFYDELIPAILSSYASGPASSQ